MAIEDPQKDSNISSVHQPLTWSQWNLQCQRLSPGSIKKQIGYYCILYFIYYTQYYYVFHINILYTYCENTLSNGGNVSGCAEYSGRRICRAVAFSVYGFVRIVPIGFSISSSSSVMHTNIIQFRSYPLPSCCNGRIQFCPKSIISNIDTSTCAYLKTRT